MARRRFNFRPRFAAQSFMPRGSGTSLGGGGGGFQGRIDLIGPSGLTGLVKDYQDYKKSGLEIGAAERQQEFLTKRLPTLLTQLRSTEGGSDEEAAISDTLLAEYIGAGGKPENVPVILRSIGEKMGRPLGRTQPAPQRALTPTPIREEDLPANDEPVAFPRLPTDDVLERDQQVQQPQQRPVGEFFSTMQRMGVNPATAANAEANIAHKEALGAQAGALGDWRRAQTEEKEQRESALTRLEGVPLTLPGGGASTWGELLRANPEVTREIAKQEAEQFGATSTEGGAATYSRKTGEFRETRQIGSPSSPTAQSREADSLNRERDSLLRELTSPYAAVAPERKAQLHQRLRQIEADLDKLRGRAPAATPAAAPAPTRLPPNVRVRPIQ